MKNIKLIHLFLLAGILPLSISGQTALSIIKKMDQGQSSNSEQVHLTMNLVNSKGEKRVRQVDWYSMNNEANQHSTLIRFTYPSDVKGTGFLEIENESKENDAWLFLPALGKSRRISSADESDSFMSTEFSYEDIGSEDIENHEYTLKGEATIDGIKCYKILAIPSSSEKKKTSGYGKRELFITKENFVLKKVLFYDKSDALCKEMIAENILQIEGTDKFRAHKIVMKNLKRQYYTELVFDNFIINKGFSRDIFSLRYLENVN